MRLQRLAVELRRAGRQAFDVRPGPKDLEAIAELEALREEGAAWNFPHHERTGAGHGNEHEHRTIA